MARKTIQGRFCRVGPVSVGLASVALVVAAFAFRVGFRSTITDMRMVCLQRNWARVL